MSVKHSPVFSLVVVYRNREVLRVKRFLDSLQQQTRQDFELIFIDYGSEPYYQKNIQALVKKYVFAQYIYTDTRGWFWNRSKALNLGIYQANTDHIITLDIDLIFEPGFLTKVIANFSPAHYTRFTYEYLPKKFSDFSKLFSPTYQPTRSLDKTNPATNFGILAFTKSVFIKAGGYDGYYQVWGLEDIDFVKRLEASGVISQGFIDGMIIYHQWHPKSQPQLSKGWYEQMHQYFQKQQRAKPQKNIFRIPEITTINQRPALQLKTTNGDKDENVYFNFTFPKELSYVKFMHTFEQLKPGQHIRVQQRFEFIAHYQRTKWGRLMHQINQLLKKLGISYRWIDLDKFNSELILKKEINDFLFHFLIVAQSQIADYYFNYQTADDNVELIVIKK